MVAVGGWLRLSDANWDRGNHLHPDERYLSIVADQVKWPHSVGAYLDVSRSPLSPYNTDAGQSYVYGTLPLFATKLVAGVVNRDDYGHLNLVGRRLSAVLDLGTTILVFLLARLVLARAGRSEAVAAGLAAAAAYALSVTAIQISHFATTDSWLVFFGTLTFYLACRAVAAPLRAQRFELGWIAVGAAFGLAVACKASGLLGALAIVVALGGRAMLGARIGGAREAAIRTAAAVAAVSVPAYLCFRLVSPYAFQSSFWLNPSISHAYRAALDAQQAALDGKILAPPGYQWLLSARVWDPLKNLIVWQLGFPLGAAAAFGLAILGIDLVRRLLVLLRQRVAPDVEVIAATVLLMLVGTVLLQFFWFATLFAHSGRYLVSLVPLLAVAAAYGLVRILASRPWLLLTAAGVILASTGIYAFGFHTVYERTNTRVAGSDWIVRHAPPGSAIANEHWDDSLPLGGDFAGFRGVTLPVFDPDDNTKLAKLGGALSEADYYVVSSPRAWRTIGRLPERFPLMVRFYRQLFAGRLGFERVASFEVEPRVLGFDLDDLGAEEAFWVYDHPPVAIFRRTRRFSVARLSHVLCKPAIAGVCG